MTKTKTFRFATLLLAFSLVLLCGIAYAGQKDNAPQQVVQPGTFSFVDGHGNISNKEILTCGPGSPAGQQNPGGGPTGPFEIDLSFGVLPAGDRLGDVETVIGTWALRSLAGPIFDGAVTRGTISPIKGGGTVYELYGYTNFTSDICNGFKRGAAGADYRTHNPVRIYGACGSNQDIVFELSRTPLVRDASGYGSFAESGVLARATLHGNVSCGRTSDRGRVRVNLSRPR